MKIISYNLNGIRSAISKGLFDWLAEEQPDVFCIQESKAQPEQIDVMTMQELGYQSYIHSAEKKGYSGVAIFTRIQPDRVVVGMGNPKYDCQGRVIRADYGDITVICVYIPSGEAEETRNGVTTTVDENGVITLNGTCDTDIGIGLIKDGKIPVKGEYTLSGITNGGDSTFYLQPYVDQKYQKTVTNETVTYTWDGTLTQLSIYIKAGAVLENVQIKPMLEKGETASDYIPYVDPASVTVARCGKNFWNSKNLTYPRTVSGVTMDYDPDTQIYTFNGTSTSAGDLYVQPNNYHIMDIKAGETWTLKVEVMGGTVDGVATCSGKMSPLANTSGYDNTIHANNDAMCSTKTYTSHADVTKMYFYIYASGIVFNNFKIIHIYTSLFQNKRAG